MTVRDGSTLAVGAADVEVATEVVFGAATDDTVLVSSDHERALPLLNGIDGRYRSRLGTGGDGDDM